MTLRVSGGLGDWPVMTGEKDSSLLLRERGERKSRGREERKVWLSREKLGRIIYGSLSSGLGWHRSD